MATTDPYRDLDQLLQTIHEVQRAHDWTLESEGLLLDAYGAVRKLRDQLISPSCDSCGRTIAYSSTGRPRRYCSDACRQASHRARTASAAAKVNDLLGDLDPTS
jgi:hypothetical protein